MEGIEATAEIPEAFEDTWTWDQRAAAAYDEVVSAGGPVASTLEAFRQMLGGSAMLAYLAMMAPRLVELKRVLRRTGSVLSSLRYDRKCSFAPVDGYCFWT